MDDPLDESTDISGSFARPMERLGDDASPPLRHVECCPYECLDISSSRRYTTSDTPVRESRTHEGKLYHRYCLIVDSLAELRHNTDTMDFVK